MIRFTDFEGQQPIDVWAFKRSSKKVVQPLKFLSCEHTKPSIEKLYPHKGDAGYTDYRRPIMTLVEDNSPGRPSRCTTEQDGLK